MEYEKCLFGVFPIWACFQGQGADIKGFWSDIAIIIDGFLSFIVNILFFGLYDREGFVFFPYADNDCKYWYQAIIKSI